MIILIKAGENEPPTYQKYSRIYKTGDIVEVLPRHPQLGDDYSPGVKAEKQFFILKIDSSQMTDKQFNDMRDSLIQPVLNPDKSVQIRRMYKFDFANTTILTNQEKIAITLESQKVSDKQLYDFSTFSKTSGFVDVSSFNSSVLNKQDGKLLSQVELKPKNG